MINKLAYFIRTTCTSIYIVEKVDLCFSVSVSLSVCLSSLSSHLCLSVSLSLLAWMSRGFVYYTLFVSLLFLCLSLSLSCLSVWLSVRLCFPPSASSTYVFKLLTVLPPCLVSQYPQNFTCQAKRRYLLTLADTQLVPNNYIWKIQFPPDSLKKKRKKKEKVFLNVYIYENKNKNK